MIGTKLHIAQAVAKGDEPLLDRMLEAPKYVMSAEVVQMLLRDDVQRAVMSVLEAGIGRLPYSPVTIEFETEAVRYFTLLSETDVENEIAVEIAWLKVTPEAERVCVVVHTTIVRLETNGFEVRVAGKDELVAYVAGGACCFAILMLNTRGIEKRVIETDKLNRARAKCGDGRPLVPRHTVVHIGTIYDKSGRAHSVTGTGRHMPVHLRSGFTRRQHYGKGNEETKLVFIAPCLVNYREDSGAKPRLPDKVVAI